MSFRAGSLAPTPVEGVNADFPFCWWCIDDLNGLPALGTCTYCRKFPYCSVECQQRHWNCHKPYCEEYIRLERWGLGEVDRQYTERVKEEETLQQRESRCVHGVAGFPPMTPDILPPWNYLHRLSKIQIFRILVDLFLETVRWESGLLAEGFVDVDGELITTEFGKNREGGFREYLEMARDADILPGRWSRGLFGQCERFAVDHNQVRTIYDDIAVLELEHYYGTLAYEGFHHVYTRLFPQMNSLDSSRADEGYCALGERVDEETEEEESENEE